MCLPPLGPRTYNACQPRRDRAPVHIEENFVKASIIGVAVLAAFVTPVAMAQGAGSYPNKALRMVVPFPPGGGNDALISTSLGFSRR